MRRDLRIQAIGWAILLATPGTFATSHPTPPVPPPAVKHGPISDALCARESPHRTQAEALDVPHPRYLPKVWRSSSLSDLERWLHAPTCHSPDLEETDRFGRRHRMLEQIRRQITKVHTVGRLAAAFAPFAGWQPEPAGWPASSKCGGCAALREAAARVAELFASRRMEQEPDEDEGLGSWVDAAARGDTLIDTLCRAMPSPAARAEIERSFRYYSWTADGSKLLDLAAAFERPDVAAACQVR